MKLLRLYFLVAFVSFCLYNKSQEAPPLVVAIVVDQMKYEFIDHFSESFGPDGFNKLINNGIFCRNTHYNYVPTYTGPGHASIFTGTTPSIHGIIGNNWYDKKTLKPVYCAGDWSSQTVCLCRTPHASSTLSDGQMSPIALLSNTVGDQLKLKDPRSKVFGVSIKDRGAILSTGAMADGAYWLNNNSQWITSSFYQEKIPDWVQDFHLKFPVEQYMSGKWVGNTFAIDLPNMLNIKGPSAIKSTPMGNQLIADFAKKIITHEKLGTDQYTDLLVVSFSSTDYVGHNYGPNSEEVKSTFLYLDTTLSDFLGFLDEKVGEKNYILMLTSDHGAASSPGIKKENRLKGGNFKPTEVLNRLNNELELAFGVKDLVWRYANMQFYLNFQTMDSLGISFEEVFKKSKDILSTEPSIDEVYNWETLNNSYPTNKIKSLINGIHLKRSGEIFLTLNPGYVEGSYIKGTSHGTHYNYDTHVPLIFYGPNLKYREVYERVDIIDIAPTISILMNVAFPNACTGNPIVNVLEK